MNKEIQIEGMTPIEANELNGLLHEFRLTDKPFDAKDKIADWLDGYVAKRTGAIQVKINTLENYIKSSRQVGSVPVFEIDYFDIILDHLPARAEKFVCLDPQKRLGDKTWAVLRSEGRDNTAIALGLFWEKNDAIEFAQKQHSNE
jgi:hypothetical protein